MELNSLRMVINFLEYVPMLESWVDLQNDLPF